MPSILHAAATITFLAFLLHTLLHRLLIDPLRRIPGPKLYALSKWRLAYEDYKGTRTRAIWKLHQNYGPVVRIGPKEVSFNSLSALRTIYGAGSGFERTSFYDMFDVYGTKNLFTFHSVKEHAERKKLLAHAYSKSVMLKGERSALIQQKVKDYLRLIEEHPKTAEEIFSSLHYFSIDAITDFLYGRFAKTACLHGSVQDRALLNDIMDVSRRKLSWFAVHLPRFTKRLYSQIGVLEKLASYAYPMQKPTTYSGIREHALKAWKSFKAAPNDVKDKQDTIISKLWKHHRSQKNGGLSDLEFASECADHLLAGIDTTADSLMFLLWALSKPEHGQMQQRLQKEIRALADDAVHDEMPTAEACDKLPYLDAVIKETLRLYAPLPASEPRLHPENTTIDGYLIPAGTTVSMAPFSLHRNADVFRDPLQFSPDRWLDNSEEKLSEMKKWFWAFSSGGRMCIGIH
jgi:cytochrome P450